MFVYFSKGTRGIYVGADEVCSKSVRISSGHISSTFQEHLIFLMSFLTMLIMLARCQLALVRKETLGRLVCLQATPSI